MSGERVTPGGPWVNAGGFEVRTALEDPIGTIRVRPTSPTSNRRFLDCDGDTWEEYESGWLRLVKRASEDATLCGWEVSIEDVRDGHGPLTEIVPDVRALLADVLDDMAKSVGCLQSYGDDMTQEIGYRMQEIFADKARELREARV
ncbi:hypothetical protein [Streptomyces chryseus]|uniref:hypothetical protein n=1 Tax=Streptomyces chryseus TaxID=68186 RepID=UPI00110FF3DA|nr:hypothetical protein [Streptomyces chryseus]GGX26699.1 hypothetical protein GCM10010353_47230 [Streptomyces chryseus]